MVRLPGRSYALTWAVIALIALAPALRAQVARATPADRALVGILLDPNGQPLEGQLLELCRDRTVLVRALTEAGGRFRFSGVDRVALAAGEIQLRHGGRQVSVPRGFEDGGRVLVVVSGEEQALRVASLMQDAAPDESDESFGMWPWIGVGAGGAAAVTGSVFLTLSLLDSNNEDTPPPPASTLTTTSDQPIS